MSSRKKKKSKAELEAEIKYLRKEKSSHAWATILNDLFRWVGLCVIAYFGYLSIDKLAGESTTADIGLSLWANIELSDVFGCVFGVGGAGYGLRQRSLRKSTVERLHSRIRHLEVKQDSGRTSSGLTPRGDTHPKDR